MVLFDLLFLCCCFLVYCYCRFRLLLTIDLLFAVMLAVAVLLFIVCFEFVVDIVYWIGQWFEYFNSVASCCICVHQVLLLFASIAYFEVGYC